MDGQKLGIEKRRRGMVESVRRGVSMRQTAVKFGVAHSTVEFWVRRAANRRLDRVDWSGRPPGRRHPVNRTSREMEDLLLAVRLELRSTSDLGEFGAEAIHRELLARKVENPPAVRTINRVLDRRGALDGRKRVRRPAPPRGWYLPHVAHQKAELDSFDFVEGLVIQGGPQVAVLTAISLHGGLAASWPMTQTTSRRVVEALTAHWSAVGRPAYAQFDNDTRFQGPHHHPDTIGRVTRLCLSLGVVPVFAPPREQGFQACIENFNGRWQAKVWARFHHDSLADLEDQSARYIAASRRRSAVRIEAAPERRPFPKRWRLNLQAQPRGRIIYLRRISETGSLTLLGHAFHVDPAWAHRLVRAQVDLTTATISFYSLRRRTPSEQELLKTVKHKVPHRPFRE